MKVHVKKNHNTLYPNINTHSVEPPMVMTIMGQIIYRQDTPNIPQGAPRIHQG